jgi:hypothetical protein
MSFFLHSIVKRRRVAVTAIFTVILRIAVEKDFMTP